MRRLLSLLIIPLPAMADETAAGVSLGTYLQAGFALCLIIGLLLGTAWLARKVSGGKGFGHGGLRVLGGVALGPRERIVLVEVGEQWLVVGIVPGQIRTLHRLPRQPIDTEASGPLSGEAGFAHWLKTLSEQRRTS